MLEIYFETYGCTANQNSSEIMKGIVRQAGLNLTSNLDIADLVVINSCIVKEPTQEKIRARVFELLKKHKKIILAGCMPRLNQEFLQYENLYLLDSSKIKKITDLIQAIQNKEYEEGDYLNKSNEVKLNLPKINNEKFVGITQISEGCLGNCAYCIVKAAKGKLFSYPQKKIIESIKKDIENNCREIWITSQDNAAYGNEYGEHSLIELLKEILKIKGNFKVRLGMMNPNNVLEILPELVEIFKNKKMFRFLHIPIQSGSDKILKLMKRKYSSKDVLKIVKKFRENIPDITIATDIIGGFPGEGDLDWVQTIDLVKKIKPEILNRSNFGVRPGTYAEELAKKNPVSPEKIKERAKEIMGIHLGICKEIQEEYFGKEVKVFIDKKGFQNTWLGRTDNYKLVAVYSTKNLLGKTLEVKIKKLLPHYLMGELFD